MGRPISVLAVIATFWSTPAFTQVQKWIDEKGTIHFEAIGPEQPEAKNPNQPKPNARRLLDRNHAGLILGDDETSFIAAHKGEYIGKTGPTETIIDIPDPFRRERSPWEFCLPQADWLSLPYGMATLDSEAGNN